MKNNIISAIILLIVINIFYACDTSNAYRFEDNTYKKIDKDKFTPLKANRRADFLHGNPRQLIKHDGLYYFSLGKRDGYLINAFDTTFTQIKDSIITYGRGPNEVLGLRKFGLCCDDQFWVYDMTKMEVNIYKKKEGELMQTLKHKLKNVYYDVEVLDKNKLVGSGNIGSRNKLTIQEIGDGVSDSKSLSFGEYGSGCEKLKAEILNDVSMSYVNVNRSNNNEVVVAYRYSDLIEIYDLQKKELTIALRGPDFINPKFNIGRKNGKTYMRKVADTKKAFVNMYSDVDNIFLIYSGGKRYTENWIGGRKLIILDWNGKIKGKYILEESTYCLLYDREREVLVTYSNESGSILEYYFQI